MSVNIPLRGAYGSGYFAIVDDDVAEEVNKHKWWISFSGKSGHYRIVTNIGRRKQLKLYHLIIGRPPAGLVTSHLNGNSLDNRRENLRHVTQDSNMARDLRRKRGYYFCNTRMLWCVSVGAGAKSINGGRFKSEEEAAKRANELRKELDIAYAR